MIWCAPMSSSRLRVQTLCSIYGKLHGIPNCCIHLVENLDRRTIDASVMMPGAAPEHRAQSRALRLAVPPLAFRVLRRTVTGRHIHAILEWRYLRSLQPGSTTWLWPGASIRTMREAKRRGHQVVLERVNSPVASAARILTAAAERLDLPRSDGIDAEAIEREAAEIELADYLFAPSPFVLKGFVDQGVPSNRLLPCSYGWDPERFPIEPRREYETSEPVFLFVGDGILRKGLPDLLEHWAAAKVPGKLRIVGPLDASIRERYQKILSQPNVETLGFQKDLVSVYRQAHVFVLPSLEEGSPLVTYLALAAGIPSLVSLAGGGGVVTNDREGLIREPDDVDGFREALARLATNADLRQQLGTAARDAAQRYTWKGAAEVRGEALLQAKLRG